MKRIIVLVLFILSCLLVDAQRVKKMEFRNQPISDILLSLAQASGRSIITDETVTGNASFFFSDADFDDALASFLSTFKLYSTKSGPTYYVSKVFASYDRERDLLTLKADEVEIQYLIRVVSKAISKTIVYDTIPRGQMTVNIDSVAPDKVVEILMKRFSDYRIEKDATYYYLKKFPAEPSAGSAVGAPKKTEVKKDGDRYSLVLERGKFLDTVGQLFATSGKEYSLLTRNDMQLDDLYFSDREFDSLLGLVLEQGNATFSVNEGVYYIYEIQKKDVIKKLKPSITVQLKYISAQDVVSLVPNDIASGNGMKVDKDSNSLILTGSPDEIDPIRTFIDQIDKPLEGRAYYRFNIKYIKIKDAIALLPPRLVPAAPIALPDGNSFIALLAPDAVAPLQFFIDMIDKKTEGFPVTLQYIKSDELMKNLPPSVSKEDVIESGVPSIVFFVGSEEKRDMFLREKAILDRPKPQIRYEILVIQHQKGSGLTWSKTLSSTDSAGTNSFVASLSTLLSLNFDVVSQFGYLFSAQLQVELNDTLAHVFADTTLSALSGQEVKFQNTSTYRYAEATYNSDTKVYTYSGSTKEITSGLILGINGWVSGDNMITMTVNATISKQGTSDSTSVTTLPPTTEKVVTTQVRTSSGMPVTIGGLKETDKSITISKVPFFGDIPLLGWLFRNKTTTNEDTEFVIYIVPYVNYGDESAARLAGQTMERYYYSYVKDFVK